MVKRFARQSEPQRAWTRRVGAVLAILIVLFCGRGESTAATEWTLGLRVENNAAEHQWLTIGASLLATDGMDWNLGAVFLPAL